MSAKFIRLGDPPTRRESQVAISLLFGHSAAQTAAELRMSVSTVECHRERLYRKFGAHRMGDLVRILMSKSLTTGENMRCYIFDIDGTIADLSHRLPHIQKEPKDWDGFFAACKDDAPIPHTIKLAIDVALAGANIVYVSGRSDQCRGATEKWLREHALPEGRVYMRKQGDHRPDFKVKVELLEQLRSEGHSPVMAFDDRNSVVKMWRELGIPCAQVADGDF